MPSYIATKFVYQNERIGKYCSTFCNAQGKDHRITKKRIVVLEGCEQTQEPEPQKKPPAEIPPETPPETPSEPPTEAPGEPAPELPEEPPTEVPAEPPPREAPTKPPPEMEIEAEPFCCCRPSGTAVRDPAFGGGVIGGCPKPDGTERQALSRADRRNHRRL